LPKREANKGILTKGGKVTVISTMKAHEMTLRAAILKRSDISLIFGKRKRRRVRGMRDENEVLSSGL
jgi:uncharacterized Zn finger protein